MMLVAMYRNGEWRKEYKIDPTLPTTGAKVSL